MSYKIRVSVFKVLFLSLLMFASISCNSNKTVDFPKEHLAQNKAVGYDEMTSILKSLSGKKLVKLESAGKSIENRDLWLLNIKPDNQIKNPLKVFLFAQQHGNEPAGKDAIVWLSKYLADNPQLMSNEIDLWLMPMVNPDGAELDQRRNADGFDLNRDHLLLSQRETQILYQVWHKIQPNVTVDCHEFNRSSSDYLEQGLEEWPQIMMDCGSNPLIPVEFYNVGVETINMLKKPLKEAGHNYCRYYLGGIPPKDENRYSTMEADDARNGMALLGSLSFIIESGVKRNAEKPDFDLGKRVDAYLTIFHQLLNNESFINNTKRLFQQIIVDNDFIPTNYFWGKTSFDIDTVMVVKNGKDFAISTGNFMQTRVIKNSVSVPDFYLIAKSNADVFIPLMDRNRIQFDLLEKQTSFSVESSELLRIENDFDEIYNRYGGRQITKLLDRKKKTFEAGSLIIYPEKNQYPSKVFYFLEPCNLYGLYQFEKFNKLIEDGVVPVYRVFGN